MQKILVVFRKWPNGDILALFPEENYNNNYECLSYERVGQHSGADYNSCIQATKPAKPEEYKSLARELERIGYQLEIRQKFIRKRSA